MCWFFKKKKKQKDVNAEASTNQNQMKQTKTAEELPKEVEKPVATEPIQKFEMPKKEEKLESVTTTKAKPVPEVKPKTETQIKSKTESKPETKKETQTKYMGKYEVYPEAGSFKYRLKASNGEILAVSLRYTTEKGAYSGIETFKKNVEAGVFEIYTDKSNYSQYQLYTANKARVIMVGEFYSTLKQAESAVESVKRFYKTDKIETLSKIADDEIREELVVFEKIEENATGKYEIYQENKDFLIRLKANNSQVLFVSQGYSSKATAKQGLETIKAAIAENRFTVGKDKQNRYQFNLYSPTNQLLLTGETYPVKTNCISAINSVRKFGLKAKVVEI